MKKHIFSLVAVFMISSIGFANTIEIKEVNELKENAPQTPNQKEEDLRICFEKVRTSYQHWSGVIVTTITYMCFDHPEIPGGGSIYIDAN